jgi:hypothetical protein
MPIIKLEEFKDRQMGVYVISADKPSKTGKNMYKVGRSIQMDKRLNSYHICFPDYFYVCKALMLDDGFTTKTKATKKKSLDMTIKIEKFIHNLLAKYRYKSSTRRKHEYFNCTEKVMDEALVETSEHFAEYVGYPIFGFKKPLYNKFFVDGIEELITSEAPPSALPQDGQKTRSGRIIKSTKDTKFADMVYIVDKEEKKKKPMIKLNMKTKKK